MFTIDESQRLPLARFRDRQPLFGQGQLVGKVQLAGQLGEGVEAVQQLEVFLVNAKVVSGSNLVRCEGPSKFVLPPKPLPTELLQQVLLPKRFVSS